MALPNLTNQNIQDTYQRVVQTDGTKIYDGTGSLLPLEFDGNNVIISGSLTAQTYVVSESIVAVTSGSTMFGNSSDDTHTFEGAITASGDISASGDITCEDITATTLFTLGPNRYRTQNDNFDIMDGGLDVSGNVTASGDISSSGRVTATDYYMGSNAFGSVSSGTTRIAGATFKTRIFGTNIKLSAPVTASGNISASGRLHGSALSIGGTSVFDDQHIMYLNGVATVRNSSNRLFINSAETYTETTLYGNFTASGNITASTINTSAYQIQGKGLANFSSDTLQHGFDSSLTNYTYGKDSDNEHLFYGNVTSSGYGVVSASSISNIARYNSTINYLTYGDADNNMYIFSDNHVVIPSARLIIGGDTTGTSDFEVQGHSKFTGHITSSGNISASGNIIIHQITSSGNISSSGNLYVRQGISNQNGLLAHEFFTANNFSNTNTVTWYNGSSIYFSSNPTQIQGNLTASGNISSSGDIVFFGGHVTASNNISASGTVFGITGSFPHIITDGDTIEFRNKSTRAVEGFLKFDTTEGLQVLDDSRNVKPNKPGLRLFKTGSHETAGTTAEGDIVRFGNSTTVAGDIYALLPDGTWTQADKRENNATCSLAAAVGTNSTTHGMLLRGMVKLDHDPDCQIGHPLYLATVGHAGCDSAAADQYARVVGSYMSGSGTVYFNPDNTWVKRSS